MFQEDRRRRFGIGGTLEAAVFVIIHNLPVFLILSLVTAGLPLLALLWFTRTAPYAWAPYLFLLQMLSSFIAGGLLQAVLVHGAAADLGGDKLDFGRMLRVTGATAVPVVALSIIIAIGVITGVTLLILPGLFVAAIWAVAIPAAVVDRTGVFRSLGRSQALTRGNRFRVLAVLAVVWVIGFALSWIFARAGRNIGVIIGQPVLVSVGGWVLGQGIAAMLSASVAAAIYFELRQVKEGVTSRSLAKVFA